MQMPPAGPLRPEQVEIIRSWIDQGAEWPDALSNEKDLPPPNPKSIALVEALRTGNLRSFLRDIARDPDLLNARGPEGSTPFMYAVLYSNAATLGSLLKKGGDPNKRNDAKATALMWAATDLDKTRLLLEHGADVNARSDDLRTPLLIASGLPSGSALVKLLLDRGANPNPNRDPASESSPLIEAAAAGDAMSMALLVARGADVKAAGQPALTMAITARCSKCVEMLVAGGLSQTVYTRTLGEIAALGDVAAVRLLLDHTADPNVFDGAGRTPLMYAAGSDDLPVDEVKLLIERGADVNATSRHTRAGDAGLTVLDIARLRGDTSVVDLLMKAGAKGTERSIRPVKTRSDNSVQSAVERSLPIIRRAAATFSTKAACVSCHNNSLSSMAAELARKKGFRVDEQIAASERKANFAFLAARRDRLHQGFVETVGDFFGTGILVPLLLGVHAEGYKPDLTTDAVAMYLKSHQRADGHWDGMQGTTRPPLDSQYMANTAMALRVLQLYAPKIDRPAYERSIERAAAWLVAAQSTTKDDRDWRLLGLAWSGKHRAAMENAKRELVGLQRSGGGWSDLPSLQSTAYATGKTLVALNMAGLSVTDGAYRRGLQFLLSTQQEDGSWYVRSRALGFQPYFDAGFPYEYDQWISAAGTNWATMALLLAAPDARSSMTSSTSNSKKGRGI